MTEKILANYGHRFIAFDEDAEGNLIALGSYETKKAALDAILKVKKFPGQGPGVLSAYRVVRYLYEDYAKPPKPVFIWDGAGNLLWQDGRHAD